MRSKEIYVLQKQVYGCELCGVLVHNVMSQEIHVLQNPVYGCELCGVLVAEIYVLQKSGMAAR